MTSRRVFVDDDVSGLCGLVLTRSNITTVHWLSAAAAAAVQVT